MTTTTLIVCAYRGLCTPTHHAIVELFRQHPEWDEVVVEQAPINRARSFAASQWYRDRPDQDVFLMVDDDILFSPRDAVQLVELCRNGHDIIGAAYPFRDGSSIAVRPLSGDTSLRFGSDEQPREVRHVGTGFFAVHRRVLDALIPTLPLCSDRQMNSAFWPLFNDRIVEDADAAGGHNWLTEDYDFAERARELGIRVWLDPSIFLAHYGQVPVTLTNREAISAAVKGTFADGAAQAGSLDTQPHLAKRLEDARRALEEEWQTKNPQTPEEIAEFYRTSEHLGADLEAWHATPARQQGTDLVVSVAKQIKARFAVDIGCGAGHELRALKAAEVATVRGVEPNERLAGNAPDDVLIYPHVGQAPIELADLLICLDVLEHVPDPESFLADIAKRAKKNAVLIESTATFDEGTPLHLEANRGWQPFTCLARYGWELVSAQHRVRVWQRLQV